MKVPAIKLHHAWKVRDILVDKATRKSLKKILPQGAAHACDARGRLHVKDNGTNSYKKLKFLDKYGSSQQPHQSIGVKIWGNFFRAKYLPIDTQHKLNNALDKYANAAGIKSNPAQNNFNTVSASPHYITLPTKAAINIRKTLAAMSALGSIGVAATLGALGTHVPPVEAGIGWGSAALLGIAAGTTNSGRFWKK